MTKNTKLLLCAAAFGGLLAGCPGPSTPADTGVDAGTRPDTGMGDGGGGGGDTGTDGGGGGVDMGTDAFAGTDTNITVDCTYYCTNITANCTGTDAQYTDMADCMTSCTDAAWTAGTAGDTTGNTLGCRIYHTLAAATAATTHCPHAGWLGGGVCTPFRTDTVAEVAVDYTDRAHPLHAEGYVRVDRMGMPAVATAIVGPGQTTAPTPLEAKNDYNDSDPSADANFGSGLILLQGVGALHVAFDDDLAGVGFTPCNVLNGFPVPGAPAPVPGCGVQHLDGSTLVASGTHAPVAGLILPDTLRVDPAGPAGFPNGRQLSDAVVDPILASLLLNLSPCGGYPSGSECAALGSFAGMAGCSANPHCTWTGTATAGSCGAAAGTRQAQCAAIPLASCNPATTLCAPSGSACVPVACEALDPTTLPGGVCGAQAGCVASTCGTGGSAPRCSLATFASMPLNPPANDVPFETAFPYFALPH